MTFKPPRFPFYLRPRFFHHPLLLLMVLYTCDPPRPGVITQNLWPPGKQEGAWAATLATSCPLSFLACQAPQQPPSPCSPGQKGKVGVGTKVGRRYGSPEGNLQKKSDECGFCMASQSFYRFFFFLPSSLWASITRRWREVVTKLEVAVY